MQAATSTAYEIISGLINETLEGGDFIPAEEARRIDEIMQREYPQEHADFLASQSHRLYHEVIHGAYASRRQHARSHSGAKRFSQIVSEGIEGLSVFQTWRCRVSDDNVQRALGDMTGADHEFVADNYQRSSERSKMYESLHRAIAKKIGDQRTSEVISEQEFLQIFNEFNPKPLPAER